MLNSRQWLLYRFLKNDFEMELENNRKPKYISTEKIIAQFPKLYSLSSKNGSKCRLLVNDIRVINDDDTIQKIIVSSKDGYKIGTEEEAQAYIEKLFRMDLKALKRDWKLSNKKALNNQMRLVFGKERDTIEAFIKE